MKKTMIMVSAVMMAATMNASTTTATSEIPVNVQPFSKVNVNVPGRVRLIKGDSYGINVYTVDKNDSTSVEYTVRNGVLNIETKCDNMRQSNGKGTVITVITPEENTTLTSGSDVYKTYGRKNRNNKK